MSNRSQALRCIATIPAGTVDETQDPEQGRQESRLSLGVRNMGVMSGNNKKVTRLGGVVVDVERYKISQMPIWCDIILCYSTTKNMCK